PHPSPSPEQASTTSPPHHLTTSPPTEPPTNWSIDSDFDRSVKSFAQFFNGQIVNLDEDADESSSSRPQDPSQPGPDVPF
ncbi:MAG: hypothetical protein AAF921_13060, partial [Cyanobacteria bacterium P01_D01_bin.44]